MQKYNTRKSVFLYTWNSEKKKKISYLSITFFVSPHFFFPVCSNSSRLFIFFSISIIQFLINHSFHFFIFQIVLFLSRFLFFKLNHYFLCFKLVIGWKEFFFFSVCVFICTSYEIYEYVSLFIVEDFRSACDVSKKKNLLNL